MREIIKDERKQTKMTQEELARKTGTRKSFISRIKNEHSDIQLSTLYRLIEQGLGGKINLFIHWQITEQYIRVKRIATTSISGRSKKATDDKGGSIR